MLASILLYGDLLIAALILMWVAWRVWRKGDRRTGFLFLLGVGLGCLWEFPLYAIGPEFSDHPPYRLLQPFPIAPIWQPISHSIWDGGLFLLGIGLATRLLRQDIWQQFMPQALLILVAWGVGSALVIEILGSNGIWEYIPSWWNPQLFTVQGKSITALAPMTWAIVPVIHYLLGRWGISSLSL